MWYFEVWKGFHDELVFRSEPIYKSRPEAVPKALKEKKRIAKERNEKASQYSTWTGFKEEENSEFPAQECKQ